MLTEKLYFMILSSSSLTLRCSVFGFFDFLVPSKITLGAQQIDPSAPKDQFLMDVHDLFSSVVHDFLDLFENVEK